MANLNSALTDPSRQQIVGTDEAAKIVNLSADRFRRLCKLGHAPAPMQIGLRKLGWRRGDLLDWLESRIQTRVAA